MLTVLPTTAVSVASFAGGAASVTAAAAYLGYTPQLDMGWVDEWVGSENYNFYWVGLVDVRQMNRN